MDNSTAAAAGAFAGLAIGFAVFMILFALAIYVYYSICLMKIAKKTGTSNGWFAWIPILNLILMIQCAKKPMWWIIMFFIPFANIVFGILVWIGIAEAVKKPSWWGIMTIVPVMNLIMPGYLAFSKMEEVANNIAPPISPVPPVQPVV